MKDYIQKIISVFTASGHSEKVTNEVHQWLTEEEHVDEKEVVMQALWEETEGKVDADTWTSLEKVYARIGVGAAGCKKQYHLSAWKYAAAIAILLVAVSGTFWFTKLSFEGKSIAMIEKYIPDGKMEMVELPDGSRVHVNSGTLLLYPDAFKGDTRTVYLIGEANFKVKKDPEKPFIVRSANVSVTALGTEFNVNAYPEDNEIVATLIHGKVKVECDQQKEPYILSPGQQIVYNRKTNRSEKAGAILEDVTAWQRGQVAFRGSTMQEILSTLERRYDISIQCSTTLFTSDRYNFSFRKDADIKEVMDVMKEVTGKFTYKIDEKICYIKSAEYK